MKTLFSLVRCVVGISCFVVISRPALAQTNAWTSPTSGNWQDANWSLGKLPGTGQDIAITNSGWKAIGISPATAANFSNTLSVHSIALAATSTNINTLLLNFAGTAHPLIIGTSNSPGSLSIDASSVVIMLSSALQVRNTTNGPKGAFDINGTFTESTGSQVSAAFLNLGRTGIYNLTNSALFGGNENISGHLYQQGGTNFGNLVLQLDSHYDLYGGFLSGTVDIYEPGIFIQHGGSVSGSLDIGSGLYELDAGFVSSSNIFLGGDYPANYPYGGGSLYQTGGTNLAGGISMFGPGSYTLSGGVLNASTLNIEPFNDRFGQEADTFTQSGGYHTNGAINLAGGIGFGNVVSPGAYLLSGGTLETPLMSLNMGALIQTGGTNRIGTLTMANASTCLLSNGLLVVSNFVQSGTPLTYVTGVVVQAGGTLIANNIEFSGSTTFWHSGGALRNAGTLTLGGATWEEGTTGESLGSLEVALSNSMSLPSSNSCVLQFADSSSLTWSNATLVIENWSGSLYGGGSHQLFFGSSASGLNTQELADIRFHAPAGLALGDYPARILLSGEVVPDSGHALPLSLGLMTSTPGNVRLAVRCDIGSRYRVDISSDLQHWSPWTNEINTTGTITIQDPTSNAPMRFYRAILVP